MGVRFKHSIPLLVPFPLSSLLSPVSVASPIPPFRDQASSPQANKHPLHSPLANGAGGDCHYMAGSVARFSELHLQMRGTLTIVGTCGLADHIKMNRGSSSGGWWDTIERQKLRNGLCYYDTPHETEYLRITN